jgi:hypothetical protein
MCLYFSLLYQLSRPVPACQSPNPMLATGISMVLMHNVAPLETQTQHRTPIVSLLAACQ